MYLNKSYGFHLSTSNTVMDNDLKKVMGFYNKHPFRVVKMKEQTGKCRESHYFEKILPKEALIADIGCGSCHSAKYFIEKRYNVICIDFSFSALKLLSEEFSDSFTICSDNNNLPIRSNSFDALISHGVIHHNPQPVKCFRELIRSLKPKGYLKINIYRKDNIYYYLYKVIGGAWGR